MFDLLVVLFLFLYYAYVCLARKASNAPLPPKSPAARSAATNAYEPCIWCTRPATCHTIHPPHCRYHCHRQCHPPSA